MSSMIMRVGIVLLAAAYLFISTAMAAGSLPKLTGDVSSPECSDAFRLAKSMFNSKSSRLYAPLLIPDGMNSELVLGTMALDISGGGAIEANEDIFEKVPRRSTGSVTLVERRTTTPA